MAFIVTSQLSNIHIYSTHLEYAMATDGLVTQMSRVSAAMVLTPLSWNILLSVVPGLGHPSFADAITDMIFCLKINSLLGF